MLRALVLVLLLLPHLAVARTTWVEVTGRAAQAGAQDADAARRRAMADALLQAALAGGTEVTGHSAQSLGRITADLVIVRPVGRVLEHRVLDERFDGTFWQVRIAARVGPAAEGACAARPLRVAMTAPEIRVSTRAPAWTEALAQDIARRLRDGLAQQPGVQMLDGSAAPRPGDHRLTARIEIATAARGRVGKSLTLALDLALTDGQGRGLRDRVQGAVALPGVSPLGRAGVLLAPGRDRMAPDLTRDMDPALARIVRQVHCAPVSIVLSVAGGRIIAPVGRQNGLSRGAIAFTTDRDTTTEMLEIVELGPDRAVLRPLDPQRPATAFGGRPVQFLETGR